jgi:hypothetical protein
MTAELEDVYVLLRGRASGLQSMLPVLEPWCTR